MSGIITNEVGSRNVKYVITYRVFPYMWYFQFSYMKKYYMSLLAF